ncbi:uncharacterized protein EV420DRAFT_1519494 [Desarmillaria tabescens]|uniref:Uncharacterized protein n=1 Tax=Armillaria tabescens TaxID=1929756 RepID=A0AA39NDM2_ARMTA|nr:uncharacterized protein EV420DRAFT_1519494 [Desarmillaria tabescens]KAK0463685.1 hypothetical protein EV420DRAFT_1519494 [Desarmillaria tabescens]
MSLFVHPMLTCLYFSLLPSPPRTLLFFFGQIGPTTASLGFPLERFERETTLGRRTNGRKPPPVRAFFEYLRGGEIMIL